MEFPISQPEKPSVRQGSWERVCGRLCTIVTTAMGSVGGPGVTVDLQDQLGKLDRDLRRAKINLNPPT